jgi:glutaminyl-peptide cyclotransferase
MSFRSKWVAPYFWANRKAVFPLALLSFGLFITCKPKPSTTASTDEPFPSPVNLSRTVSTPPLPPNPPEIWKAFEARRALQHVREICRLGPRPAGSEAIDKAREYVTEQLRLCGWQVLSQRFDDQTPEGQKVGFCNLLAQPAQLNSIASRIAVVAYLDSARTDTYRDVGATDGAASSAILLEIARVLSSAPRLASITELIFLDGHQPFRQPGLNDGLFGSRFITQMLKINQQIGSYQAAIVLAHQGGQDLRLYCSLNSDPGLIKVFRQAALSLSEELEVTPRPILTDQVPFAQAGIPALALLDPGSPFLQTADDVPERVSAEALAKSGALVLYYLSSQQVSAHQ